MKYLIPMVLLGLVILALGAERNFSSVNAATAADSTKAAADTTASAKTTPKEKPKAKEPAAGTVDKGIGPITEVKLDSIDEDMAADGERIFTKKCTVCHQLDTKKVGPPLRDIVKQQAPEFIMNMILNADVMEKKDPIVKKLVAQYQTYMTGLDLNQDQARKVLEYLRSASAKGAPK